jgi:hypothetical protein
MLIEKEEIEQRLNDIEMKDIDEKTESEKTLSSQEKLALVNTFLNERKIK